MSNSDNRYEFEMSDEMIGSLIKGLLIVIVILLMLLGFCFFKSNIFANNDSSYIIDHKEYSDMFDEMGKNGQKEMKDGLRDIEKEMDNN